eukprot:XP_015582504.1 cyclic dof factor 2 isoform X2 [Ricinus communis]
MSEPKDPAIKLFGKMIPFPEISTSTAAAASATTCSADDDCQDRERPSCASSSLEEGDTTGDGEERESDKDAEGETLAESKQENGSEESSNPDSISGITENPKTSSVEKDDTSKTSKTEEEQSDTSNSQEKTPKKPDKILPCPRCNSMDTKFCYYNNYNVNQPRHFCKNCQRYWTAGGTMRNVPVGAGRRKNKNSASHYRHITVSEALQNVQNDIPNGIHHPALKISYAGVEHGDAHSKGSLATASNSKDEASKSGPQATVIQNCQGFPPQIPCYPGTPWPYPWNSAQWSSPVPPTAFCPPGFPMPFYPTTAYWGCTVPGTWNMSWIPQPPSPNETASTSGPNSPTLGKHSRDDNMLKPSNSGETPEKEKSAERCLWIPKTLRIDDPGEAAKSSIWTTLGIKNDRPDSIGGRGLFKAFESKGNEKNHAAETSSVLQANPAALSRSLKFRESS